MQNLLPSSSLEDVWEILGYSSSTGSNAARSQCVGLALISMGLSCVESSQDQALLWTQEMNIVASEIDARKHHTL